MNWASCDKLSNETKLGLADIKNQSSITLNIEKALTSKNGQFVLCGIVTAKILIIIGELIEQEREELNESA